MNKQNPRPRSFLGQHTTLSYIANRPEVWRRIPYLKENQGRAPPIALAVGDRRRVYAIAQRLRKPVLLSEIAARLSNRRAKQNRLRAVPEFGRVAMAIGLTSANMPILAVETQMGAPATQIIMEEILSDKLTTTNYRVAKTRVSLPHKIVIRVGTAAGINCQGKPAIHVGDIVNATHSIGVTGSTIQSLLGLDFWRPRAMKKFRNQWLSLGSDFTFTRDGHPRVECSKDVVEALDVAGGRLTPELYHKGGNITKDSLYAERSDKVFVNLCRRHDCRSTEMELSAIALAARAHNAHFGMVSAIVGVLPGASFTESEALKASAEGRSLRVALEALKYL